MSEILIERLQDAVREMTRTELLSLCWEAADALTAAQARIAELEALTESRILAVRDAEMTDDLQRVIETSERLGQALRDGIELVEMLDEFNTPGTDAYTWLMTVRPMVTENP